jgi:predicted metal-dependent peptidase
MRGFLETESYKGKVTSSKYLCAVDVSGSTQQKDFKRYHQEIKRIYESLPSVDYVEFSDTTKEIKSFDSTHTYVLKPQGRTTFDNVVFLAAQCKYTHLIIFTDGFGELSIRPENVNVTWCLIEDRKPPVKWGNEVCLQYNQSAILKYYNLKFISFWKAILK